MFETYLKDINNGVFIEAGAFNGTTQSNTKALEERYGWTGILFEPSPDMYGQCVKSRTSKVYNCALVSDSYKYDYIKGDFDLNHPMSSLNGTRLVNSTSLIEVPAKTLQSCLDECNIKHVDFFSLDVEGCELDVLNGIDWSKTSFSYLLIEFNPDNIKTLIKFMNSKGYSFIENVTNFSKMTNPGWDGQHNDYLFISQSNIITKQIVICHYNEDLSWLNNLRMPFQVISRQGIPEDTYPNEAREASVYLEYIIKNYNSLSDITIFLHGHRSSWHNLENIDEKLNKLVFDKDYCNINDHAAIYLKDVQPSANVFISQIPIIDEILGMKIDINHLTFKCSSQFYVSKQSIHRHSRETYIRLYDYILNSSLPSVWTSHVFEYIWHIIFTRDINDMN